MRFLKALTLTTILAGLALFMVVGFFTIADWLARNTQVNELAGQVNTVFNGVVNHEYASGIFIGGMLFLFLLYFIYYELGHDHSSGES